MAAKSKTKAKDPKQQKLSRMLSTDPILVAMTRGEWAKLNGFHDGKYEK